MEKLQRILPNSYFNSMWQTHFAFDPRISGYVATRQYILIGITFPLCDRTVESGSFSCKIKLQNDYAIVVFAENTCACVYIDNLHILQMMLVILFLENYENRVQKII